MADWQTINIHEWTSEHVKQFIQKKCEPAAVPEELLEGILQQVDKEGINGTTLITKQDSLPELFGPAVAAVPPAMLTAFKKDIKAEYKKAQDRDPAGDAGKNFAPQSKYNIVFREGIKKPVSVQVTADMTLQQVKDLFVKESRGDANFTLANHKELTLTKTLRELGLTEDGCAINIVSKNRGG
eukprot:CAMPEP_0197052262 /NCGR_PEP_ID=MMETSP1384-20130603/26764_1 /TAXON_ID=29189 /ORGANISM="Ammonia sp." /LENGTH=182 /DNA_ID=CAMNT_0042484947 /DNA_START=92 /DNA_END=640 /DNA_ORIENTATION=-